MWLLVAVVGLGVSTRPTGAGKLGDERFPLEERELWLIESAQRFEAQVESGDDLYGDPRLNALVSRVGLTLAPPPKDAYLEYRFHILRDPQPGAFALPDGQVYVSLGMLAILENEVQLATLLAHEIHHVAGHHGFRRHRSSRRKSLVGLAGAVVLASALVVLGEDPSGLFEGAGRTPGEEDVAAIPAPAIVGYRWSHEKDADLWAIRRVAEVGYDPSESARLLELLGRDSTVEHADDRTKWGNRAQLRKRVAVTRRVAAKIGGEAVLETSEARAELYSDLRWRAALDTVQEYRRAGHAWSALSLAEALVEQRDSEPEAHFALAESCLDLGDQLDDGHAKALSEYARTLRLDPGFAEAHRGRGFALLRLGMLAEAGRELELYLRARPRASDRSLVLRRLR
ncbi:MAG: M48 family metalloprotease, partial [bacterium]|nr:M48 family metalloprotease [bacterium]